MFERKSMEQILQDMVDWTRGASKKLTDFRVGSKVRTIYEATAVQIEELYDKVYTAIKTLIAENVYTVMGFPKRQAVFSTATVTFGRASAAGANYLISAGTIIATKATATQAPVRFRTTADAVLAIGETSVDVSAICLTAGKIGNTDAGTLTDFVTKPVGIETVTNSQAVTNGLDVETADEQKVRFQKYVKSLQRGTIPAIEYGALIAVVTDGTGAVTERVVSSKAFEDTVNSLGEVSCYIWNGVGAASSTLITNATQSINGYYDPVTGAPVIGYKAAGTLVTVYSATAKSVTIKLTVTPNASTTLTALQPSILNEVLDYFASLELGQTLIYSTLFSKIKDIDGVDDLIMQLSTNGGSTYTQNTNVTAAATEICKPVTPIIYV